MTKEDAFIKIIHLVTNIVARCQQEKLSQVVSTGSGLSVDKFAYIEFLCFKTVST